MVSEAVFCSRLRSASSTSGFCSDAVSRTESCKWQKPSMPLHSLTKLNIITKSFGANNLAAAACSPIFSVVLQKFGSRTTLIAWAIIAGAGISLGILFVKPRVPVKSEEGPKASFSWQPFRRPRFYLFALSMFLQGLGNFLPAAYLPSYSTDIGLPLAQGSLLITFLSLSGMIGQSLLGLLT